jgi:hypothetical protein
VRPGLTIEPPLASHNRPRPVSTKMHFGANLARHKALNGARHTSRQDRVRLSGYPRRQRAYSPPHGRAMAASTGVQTCEDRPRLFDHACLASNELHGFNRRSTPAPSTPAPSTPALPAPAPSIDGPTTDGPQSRGREASCSCVGRWFDSQSRPEGIESPERHDSLADTCSRIAGAARDGHQAGRREAQATTAAVPGRRWEPVGLQLHLLQLHLQPTALPLQQLHLLHPELLERLRIRRPVW